MVNVIKKKPVRQIALAAGGVYATQGIIGGLTYIGMPAYIRMHGASLDQIGLVSLVMLVWVLKFFWSSWIERLRIGPNGRRFSSPIIIIAECGVLLCLAILGFYENVSTILLCLVFMAIFSATADIACDAFLIEQLKTSNYGLGNIAQVGGSYSGLIFGGGIFLWVCDGSGWRAGCIFLGILIAVCSIPMMLVDEPLVENSQPLQKPRLLKAVVRKNMLLGLAMVIAYEMAGRIVQSLVGPLLVDLDIPLASLGMINGVGGVVSGLIGVLAGGALAQKLGSKNAMRLVALLQIVVITVFASFLISQFYTLPLFIGLTIGESAIMAAGFVTCYSRLMELVSKDQPGVDFTLFQSASALTAALAGAAGNFIAQYYGYSGAFALAALIAIATPMILKSSETHVERNLQS
ncbi:MULTISPECIES: MFS transporter [Bartonella]|uniref:MFS transporter n=1 Tax=Bartonella TaxID=773 RepID=UPI0018DB3A9F|nr:MULTISPECIES: MFS transporter [Bartonella]MBH9975953.1 MFS transporter [Bartonella choladocola]MBI0015705.1 MFS transporter [Bartonella sp. B10834G3]